MVHRKMSRDRRRNTKNDSFNLYKNVKEQAGISRAMKGGLLDTNVNIISDVQ